ncbi:MAG: hypothetical protein V2A73_18720 [Pseudomonadota bacterium]
MKTIACMSAMLALGACGTDDPGNTGTDPSSTPKLSPPTVTLPSANPTPAELSGIAGMTMALSASATPRADGRALAGNATFALAPVVLPDELAGATYWPGVGGWDLAVGGSSFYEDHGLAYAFVQPISEDDSSYGKMVVFLGGRIFLDEATRSVSMLHMMVAWAPESEYRSGAIVELDGGYRGAAFIVVGPDGQPMTLAVAPEGNVSFDGELVPGGRVWATVAGNFIGIDVGSGSTGYCGDGYCGDEEDNRVCPEDCSQNTQDPYCGDGLCEGDEYEWCREDCGEYQEPYCGNGLCERDEYDWCREDCGEYQEPYCGNGLCEGDEYDWCREDCGEYQEPYCGNGLCEGDEYDWCREDCGEDPSGGEINVQELWYQLALESIGSVGIADYLASASDEERSEASAAGITIEGCQMNAGASVERCHFSVVLGTVDLQGSNYVMTGTLQRVWVYGGRPGTGEYHFASAEWRTVSGNTVRFVDGWEFVGHQGSMNLSESDATLAGEIGNLFVNGSEEMVVGCPYLFDLNSAPSDPPSFDSCEPR